MQIKRIPLILFMLFAPLLLKAEQLPSRDIIIEHIISTIFDNDYNDEIKEEAIEEYLSEHAKSASFEGMRPCAHRMIDTLFDLADDLKNYYMADEETREKLRKEVDDALTLFLNSAMDELGVPTEELEIPTLDVLPQEMEETVPLISLTAHIPNQKPVGYHDLTISKKDRANIKYIITTMAKHNPIALAFKKGSLNSKGDQIEHVHPLRFLGTIIGDLGLRKELGEISDSFFKWGRFVKGFSRRMNEEYKKNNINRHITEFGKIVNRRPEKLQRYVIHKDWEGLIKHCIREQ